MATTPTFTPAPEKYLVAFVIEGDDVFKVTVDNVVQAADGAGSVAFEGVAKLKAAVALFQLTNVHNERPNDGTRAGTRGHDAVGKGQRCT